MREDNINFGEKIMNLRFNKTRVSKFVNLAIKGAACAVLTLPMAYNTQAQEAKAEQDSPEIITVTGVRGSLGRALYLKRESTGIVDGISAEDIGKFPDLNIGEALGRISGVTITRSPGGEGNRVSIRGGQADWTAVTVNGLQVASGNQGREFDFDVFASELFSNVKISKSPSANIAEGGLTGTVDLQTPRPFNIGDKMAFSVAGTDAAKGNNDILPRVSGLYSKQFEDFGVLFSAAYSKTGVRGDISQGWGWNVKNRGLETYINSEVEAGNPVSVNINGSNVTDPAELLNIANNTITPLLPRLGPQLLERERLGLTGAFQWAVNDNVTLSADILYASFTQDETRATIDGLPGFNIGKEWSHMTIENGIAVAGTVRNQVQRSETLYRQFDTELLHTTIGLDWQIDDTWELSTEIGSSEANEDELSRTFLFSNTGTWSYDFANPKYPVIGGENFDWLDPNDYTPEQLRYRPFERKDEAQSFSLDLEGSFDHEGLTGLSAGILIREQEKGQTRIAEQRPSFTGNFADYSISAIDLFGSSYLSDSPSPKDFLLADVVKASNDFLPDGFSTDIDLIQTYTVTEKTVGAYIKADFELEIANMPLRFDLGTRFVNTKVESSGYVQGADGPQAITLPGEYSDWLPSLNMALNASDDVVIRFAANRTMTRPTLNDIAPAVSVFPTTLSANSGNPDLQPFRSNNLDLSLEWYIGGEGLLSAAIYYKDIETFITKDVISKVINCGDIRNDSGENVCGSEFQVNTPVNGDDGKLKGVELQYQQPFTFLPEPFDGLGALVNITLSDSERTGSDGKARPLQGQSETSYNIVGYYEKDDFTARVAYSYRSDYQNAGRNGFDYVTDAYGQVDLSLRYSINANFEVFFEGLNMLEEDVYVYAARTNENGSVNDYGKVLNQEYSTQGRILQLGVRGSF